MATSAKYVNPFTDMSAGFSPQDFYGRRTLLHTILKGLSQRVPQSYGVSGIRKIGKTALLRYLYDTQRGALSADEFRAYRPDGFTFLMVYIRFDERSLTDDRGLQVFRRLLEYLYREVTTHPNLDLNTIPSMWNLAQIATAKLEPLFMELCSAIDILARRRYRVVFLLDDFDRALEFMNRDQEGYLSSLAKIASFVVTVKRLEPYMFYNSATVFDADEPPSIFMQGLPKDILSIFSIETARSLARLDNQKGDVVAGAADGRREGSGFDESEVDFLLEVAGRHPAILAASCAEYHDYKYHFGALSLHALQESQSSEREAFIERLLGAPQIARVLRLWWTEATSQFERQLLNDIASGENLHLTGLRADSVTTEALDVLRDKSLVYVDVGVYYVSGELFRRYIRSAYQAFLKLERPTTAAMMSHVERELGPTDQRVFHYLVENANQLCDYDTMLSALWPDAPAPMRALNASINRLRNALNQLAPQRREYIVNERSKGYRFVSDPPLA